MRVQGALDPEFLFAFRLGSWPLSLGAYSFLQRMLRFTSQLPVAGGDGGRMNEGME